MANEFPVVVQAKTLTEFCVRVFQKLGVPEEDARITTDVLVMADLRGIDSHGVARFRRYVDGLKNGVMMAKPATKVVRETPATALIDAGAGLGQPVSHRAMEKALKKAQKVGAGFVSVTNSNHYGIAGYYAMMALDHDCIGMSMTSGRASVVPTFGRNAMLGTNPIAVAAPANKERPFVMDMATSIVPHGKLEVYDRLSKPMPLGWAIDERGIATNDTHKILYNMMNNRSGGLLPLGGEGELLSGHKGYGLSLWVEIFCAVLSGAAFASLAHPISPEDKPLPANVGHFFGAWSVEAFRPIEEFKAAMDDMQRLLKNTPKAEGQDRVYIHGEKEYEETELHIREGIHLNPKVAADLKAIGEETGVGYNLKST